MKEQRDKWVSKLGLVLAMAGNAVGLGNFLRFPTQAAGNGGGAFMIPYVIAFLLLGLPLMLVEWAMGRYGGSKGQATLPGIFGLIRNNKLFRWIGVMGIWIPLFIASYYVFIESWTLGYSFFSLLGTWGAHPTQASLSRFFTDYISYNPASGKTFIIAYAIFLFTIALNSFILYRGISKGIEKVAKVMMPALFIFALILMIRVITLGTPSPIFSMGEIKNYSNLVRNLSEAKNPAQKAVWAGLDEKTKQLITQKYVDGKSKEVLLASLTRIAGRDNLYDKKYFGELELSSYSKALLKKGIDHLTPEEEKQLNLDIIEKTLTSRISNRNTGEISPKSVTSWPFIINNLKEGDKEKGFDPAKKHLWDLLDEKARAVVNEKEVDLKTRLEILAGLNGILTKKDFFNPEIFNAHVSPKAMELYKKGPANLSKENLVIMNRMAVESAFPRELDKVAEKNISRGFGFIWNPDPTRLGDFSIWLAAAGQIFFTLSLGMGAIACYASYVHKDDDIVTSGLTTALTNETCEVILGGSIAIPLAVAFFGLTAAKTIAAKGGFSLAFISMPAIFSEMPLGQFFGFAWFGLLFFAGITSSLAMGQIIVAFLEEIGGLSRKWAVISAMGTVFILAQLAIFIKGGLEEMDYLAATFGISAFALLEIVIWVHFIGLEKSWEELTRGAKIRLPKVLLYIMAYVAPLYLAVIFIGWVAQSGRQVLFMENIPVENRMGLWIVRIVMIAMFLIIGFISTRNMNNNKNRKEVEEAAA